MLFEFDDFANQAAKIKVVGAGGAGGNAINRMVEAGLIGVDFIAVNTDAQDLDSNLAGTKIQIGKDLTKGLGAGAVREIGRQAMENDKHLVSNALNGADMVFITAGFGGGTGTGASPIIAKIAKEQGCLTVAIVTKPFKFEGPKRTRNAEEGLEELKKCVDTLIVIPNQQLLNLVDRKTTLQEAFKTADSVLYQATRGISDLINNHGIINLDFADVRTIMKNMGKAIMGTGVASGEERAILAAQQAISSPLLDDMSIKGAQGLLISITGGKSLNLFEVDEACQIITQEASPDADIIFGAVIDEKIQDEIIITVIATGFETQLPRKKEFQISSKEATQIETITPLTPEKEEIRPPIFEFSDEEQEPAHEYGIPAFIRYRMNAV
jgi:cell division protein FtsZ